MMSIAMTAKNTCPFVEPTGAMFSLLVVEPATAAPTLIVPLGFTPADADAMVDDDGAGFGHKLL
jgi:hypothetical protein